MFRFRKFNTTEVCVMFSVTMRQGKTGEPFFSVDYNINGEVRTISFSSMSSVIDFIKSNY